MTSLVDSVEQSFEQMPWLRSADTAAKNLALKYALAIDEAVEHGTTLEVTKALYLGPHLLNALRDLGATPAGRKAMQSSSPVGGALAGIRANLPAGARGAVGEDDSEAVDPASG